MPLLSVQPEVAPPESHDTFVCASKRIAPEHKHILTLGYAVQHPQWHQELLPELAEFQP